MEDVEDSKVEEPGAPPEQSNGLEVITIRQSLEIGTETGGYRTSGNLASRAVFADRYQTLDSMKPAHRLLAFG